MIRKILILTASPKDAERLQVHQEIQSIQDKLRGDRLTHPKKHCQFEIVLKCARPGTLLDDIENEKPEIIHFGGHGTEEGLLLEDDNGHSHPVSNAALKRLFQLVGNDVKCVILNSCHSKELAKSISEYVPYVIGMEGAILDRTAIAFASGFYKALGDGKAIESAFDRGSIAAHFFDKGEVIELFKQKSLNRLEKIWNNTQHFVARTLDFVRYRIGQRFLLLIGLICVGISVALLLPGISGDRYNSLQAVSEALCSDQVGQGVVDSEIVPSSQEKGLISSGETVLLTYRINSDLVRRGAVAFKQAEQGDQNYESAISLFREAIKRDKSNPEPYVYLNNAIARNQAREQTRKPYVLVAAIPASSDTRRNRAEEMLRGIVDAQACFNGTAQKNCSDNPKEYLLEVKLVDDANDPEEVVPKVAREIAQNRDVVGVIGHFSSNATKVALPIYERYRLGVISPTSTSSDLKSEFFFRTTVSSRVYGKKIVDQIRKYDFKQVIGFIDPLDDYSRNQWNEVEKLLQADGIRSDAIELSDQAAEQKIDRLNSNEDYAYVLIPPSTRTDKFTSDAEIFQKSARIAEKLSQKRGSLFIGGTTLYSSTTLAPNGSAFEGMVVIAPWFARSSAEAEAYAEIAADKWGGQVNWATASSYDATQAFTSALSSIDETLNRDELRGSIVNALRSVTLSPPRTSGTPLQFDGEREPTKEPLLVRVVRGRDCSPIREGYVFQMLPNS
ncbi:MAG: ABC transporter substrate-binding protein [Drouetiella hepatica Uher 2000/2452]|jgi:branched-chain amino acid transport system substrate-binding protein|uniref:ABC transporter substrate-binding protein n=1 Tax=Drouetiella hepatica Uher 2000/2452 TaxID=904376 RepID=A0A951UPV5_9CYAN|nr:ABC transporter substrate-binding protein [Drouetiella hepatica Uher 2000/2452]